MCVCLCVHTCVHQEIGEGEQGHPFETPACSFLWCDGRAGAHTHNSFALINPCLTGKISKGIFKHLPYPLLMSLSWEGGKLGRMEHQLWRYRCDNQHQDQHGTEEGRALCSPLPSRLGEGRCCAFVTGLPCVQVEVGLGATRIIPTTLGVCWVLAFWFRKQKPTVISVDLPYHLEPVNNVNKM